MYIFLLPPENESRTNAANLPDPDNDTAFWGRGKQMIC